MPSTKHLSSVCHNIADYAAGGLGFINPYLFDACRDAGVDCALVDLMVEAPYPDGLPVVEPLRLALGGLRVRAEQLLQGEGFRMTDLVKLDLLVDFRGCAQDGHSCNCYVTITHSSGKTFGNGANTLGQKVTKLDV